MSNNVILRDAADEDKNFIISSWLKTYRTEGKFTRRIRPYVYFKEHEERIKRALWQAKARIACLEAEPEVIMGYAVWTPQAAHEVVHFVFVRPEFRNLGVARKLLSEVNLETCEFTHWVYKLDNVIDELLTQYPKMNYNPYLF